MDKQTPCNSTVVEDEGLVERYEWEKHSSAEMRSKRWVIVEMDLVKRKMGERKP